MIFSLELLKKQEELMRNKNKEVNQKYANIFNTKSPDINLSDLLKHTKTITIILPSLKQNTNNGI